ncbi:MAG: hypothetical protein CMG46_12900 [Candidatus Marinimicrobia bacterium]|nr:hypothetical protein [Candidatus Neomarinimicrobiota bacterium]
MKLLRILTISLLFILLSHAPILAESASMQSAAVNMTQAVNNFIAALSPEQRAIAILPFTDKRTDWHFLPTDMYARPGIRLKDLTATQSLLAHAVISSGLSQEGYIKATTIMSLEEILHDLEEKMDDEIPVRDPSLYFVAIFGEPKSNSTWGWNVQGHHISLHFTVVKGKMVATTPTFLGTNPAEVKSGPRKGLRVLAREEDMARTLLNSLDDVQKAKAKIIAEVPRDIFTSAQPRVKPLEGKGLSASEMNTSQRQILVALLEEYANTMPSSLSAARMKKIHKAGLENIVISWIGSTVREEPHYYRLQGPTFLIEYDNIQNSANHIHTVWRDFDGDFGADLLADHYKTAPHHQD